MITEMKQHKSCGEDDSENITVLAVVMIVINIVMDGDDDDRCIYINIYICIT